MLVHDDAFRIRSVRRCLKKRSATWWQLPAEHEILLIEDDVYAELHFDKQRPKPAKAFDRKGLVLQLRPRSPRLAPGYSIGLDGGGSLRAAVQRRKVTTSLATSVPIQNGIAQMLRNEGYDRHLEKLRQALRSSSRARRWLPSGKHFPAGFRSRRPRAAISCGSSCRSRWTRSRSIAGPSRHISASRRARCCRRAGQFRNCLRLNYGHPWTAQVDGRRGRAGSHHPLADLKKSGRLCRNRRPGSDLLLKARRRGALESLRHRS